MRSSCTALAICALVASRDAKAACVLHGARPTVPLPTMELGQEFSFIASPDCETLRFTVRGTTFSKMPKSGDGAGPGPDTYKVRLTESEWDAVVAELGATLTWVVTGRTSTGEVTRLVTTNHLATHVDVSTAGAVLVGDENNYVGYDPVFAGDVNGDGNDDLFIAGWLDDEAEENAGAAYVVLGPVTGTVELSHAHAKLLGEEQRDSAGESISGAGDVNGDGNDDLLLGVRFNDEAGASGGAAYLVLGPVSGTFDLSLADAKLLGEDRGDEAGWSVAGAGDVDADGHDDVLVGTGLREASTGHAGTAYLLNGPVTGTFGLGRADATLDLEPGIGDGTRVTGVGDANGDGNADVLIGSPYDGETGGAAYLLLGPAIGAIDLGTAADAKLLAEAEGDRAGHRLAWAGDADGDGNDDLLVGAAGNDEGGTSAGAAYLFLSPVTGEHDLGTADAKLIGGEMDSVGERVAGAGDMDADGRDDLLVADYSGDGRVGGVAYLVRTPVSGTIEIADGSDVTFLGQWRDDVIGGGIDGGNDVDADGRPDLLLNGAHRTDEGEWVGAAFLFYGAGL